MDMILDEGYEFEFHMLDQHDDIIQVWVESESKDDLYIMFVDKPDGHLLVMSLDAARVDSLIAALQEARQRMTEAGE